MPYTSITSYNMTEGFQTIFVYVNEVSGGIFINFLLFIIWFGVSLGIFFSQKKMTAQGDFPMSLAVGGFVTAIITILFKLIPNLINNYTYMVVLVASTLSMLWFLSTKKDNY